MVETSLGLNVQNFAVAFKVDPKVLEWFQKGGIFDCEGIASLAAKEKLVDARFIRRELFPVGLNDSAGLPVCGCPGACFGAAACGLCPRLNPRGTAAPGA